MLVLRHSFLSCIDAVNILRRIITIYFFVQNTFYRQSLRLCRTLIRIAYRDGSHRHHQLRQLQKVNNLLRIIDGSPQIADAQSVSLSQSTEVLRNKQSVTCGIEKRNRIVISRFGIPATAPFAETVEVGTESQHHRSRRHHRLVEMSRSKLCLHLRVSRYHYAIKLHIPHRGSTESLFQQFFEQGGGKILLFVLADSPPILYTVHIHSFFCKLTQYYPKRQAQTRKIHQTTQQVINTDFYFWTTFHQLTIYNSLIINDLTF